MNFNVKTWQPIQWVVVVTFMLVYLVTALNPWYYSLAYRTQETSDFQDEYVEPAYVAEDGTAYNFDNQMIDDFGNIIDERGNILEEYQRPEPLEEDFIEEEEFEEGTTVGELSEEERGVYGVLGDEEQVPLDYNGNPIYSSGQGPVVEEEDPNAPRSLREAWLQEKGQNIGQFDPTLSEFEMLYKDGGAYDSLDMLIMIGYVIMIGYCLGIALTTTVNTFKYAGLTTVGMIIKTIRIKWMVANYSISIINVLKWWGVMIMFFMVYYICTKKVITVSEEVDEDEVQAIMSGNL